MNRIQSILLVTATAFSVNLVYAQTAQMPAANSAMVNGQNSSSAPVRIVAPTPTDPLVQKRVDDAAANHAYSQNKKQAKADYKQKVKAAKADKKQFKHDAAQDTKDTMRATGSDHPLTPTNGAAPSTGAGG